MNKELRVLIKKDNKDLRLTCPIDTTLESLVQHFDPLPSPVAALKVNDEILPLCTKLDINARLEPVLIKSSEGAVIYRCSLAFLLAVAANKLFPGRRLYIGHSLGRSFYYTFLEDKKLEWEEINKLEKRMQELVREDLPINCRYMEIGRAHV